jgi:DNA-binding transcriptional LysR family regulator
MDTRQLEMFRAVAEARAFTAAAQRLHVSQSAVSRQLKLLEEELGTLLFHRGARGVTLTPQGELLLSAANRITREMEDVASQISDTQTLQRGRLTLGGGMTVCLHILPKLLRKFRAQYKQVDLRVVTGTTEMIVRQLRAREIDVALLTLPIREPDLEDIPVLKEEMVVVMAGKHPLARRRSIDARALARQPLILFESGSNTRRVVDQFFVDEAIPVNVVMETENVEIIKSMVASGLGITIVPYSAIAHDRTGRFAWARLRGHHLYRETGWVHLKSDYMPRAVTEVLRIFEEMKGQFAGAVPGRESRSG